MQLLPPLLLPFHGHFALVCVECVLVQQGMYGHKVASCAVLCCNGKERSCLTRDNVGPLEPQAYRSGWVASFLAALGESTMREKSIHLDEVHLAIKSSRDIGAGFEDGGRSAYHACYD